MAIGTLSGFGQPVFPSFGPGPLSFNSLPAPAPPPVNPQAAVMFLQLVMGAMGQMQQGWGNFGGGGDRSAFLPGSGNDGARPGSGHDAGGGGRTADSGGLDGVPGERAAAMREAMSRGTGAGGHDAPGAGAEGGFGARG